MQRLLLHSLSLFASLALLACGGGGGSGGGGVPGSGATANLMITDADVDLLSAFSVTVTQFVIIRSDGSNTGNLLAASRTIELLDLQGQSELLQVSAIGPGTYTGARIDFDPGSASARDLLGAPVTVSVGTGSVTVNFQAPVVVGAGDSPKVRFHVDVEGSLEDAPGGGLLFEPEIEVERQSGADELLDEVHGRLTAQNSGARQFTMRLTDRDTGVALGSIVVAVDNSTGFFDDDASMFNEAAFFAAAMVEDRVEAEGALRDDGVFLATTVKLETDNNGVGRIEGTITDLNIGALTMMLRIKEIEKGQSVLGPVLQGLGNPGVIQVGLGGASVVVEEPTPMAGMLTDLAVGQKVKVKFSAFVAAPFPARRIEIEDDRPEFEGRIMSVAGLPSGLVIRLESHDPSVLSGRVDSTSTDVAVVLDGSERIFLKLSHEPDLAATTLLTGMRVRVRGAISGPSSGPSIDASDLRIRPGRLEGTVTVGNQGASSFTVAMFMVDKPFGGAALSDPVVCSLPSGARIEKDASTIAGFYALLNTLPSGSTLEVRLFGIADGTGGLFAHEVEARVR